MATSEAMLACREMAFALKEYRNALSIGDDMRSREAAEKAWLAIVDATNHHLAQSGSEVKEGVAAHAQRRKLLEDSRDPRDTVILGKYLAFREELHGECFYAGACGTSAELSKRLERARVYVTELTGCEVAKD